MYVPDKADESSVLPGFADVDVVSGGKASSGLEARRKQVIIQNGYYGIRSFIELHWLIAVRRPLGRKYFE